MRLQIVINRKHVFITTVLLFGMIVFFELTFNYMKCGQTEVYLTSADKAIYSHTFNVVPLSEFLSKDPASTLSTVVKQRNEISRSLNLFKQKLAQLECKGQQTSSTGGWCAETSVETSKEHTTDKAFIPALAIFFTSKYVGSFGDGPGRYKQMLLDTGLLKGYDAYDGAPFSEKTSEGRVQFLELTIPQYGLPLYDWILSLEVAEHIPQEFEHVFIDNIVRHAREGILLSWAIPGQGGFSHVNNRPFEYVKSLFETRGFIHDVENSTRLQNAATVPWLRTNINVYRRKNLTDIDRLKTTII